MEQGTVLIRMKQPFNLEWTALSHGWVNLQPYCWDATESALVRVEQIGGTAVHYRTVQESPRAVGIHYSLPEAMSRQEESILMNRIERALGLDVDLKPLKIILRSRGEEDLLNILETGGGRFLRGTSLHEDIIKTIFTSNANWQFTVKMASDFCNKYGRPCSCCGMYAFPGVEDIPGSIQTKIGYRKSIIEDVMKVYGEILQTAESDIKASTAFSCRLRG